MSAATSTPIIRVSIACVACKKAKCKCSGPPAPCEKCQHRSRECVFDTTLDGRRRNAVEDTLELVKEKHGKLENLFNCLRSSDESTVDSLIEAIRNGSSLEELEALVNSAMETEEPTDEPNPNLEDGDDVLMTDGYDYASMIDGDVAGPSEPDKNKRS